MKQKVREFAVLEELLYCCRSRWQRHCKWDRDRVFLTCAPLISDAESGEAAGDSGSEKMNIVAACPSRSLKGTKASSSLAVQGRNLD